VAAAGRRFETVPYLPEYQQDTIFRKKGFIALFGLELQSAIRTLLL